MHKTYIRAGFTLLELLVVISIISLLSAVILTSVQTSRNKAIDSKKIQMAAEYRKAIELYRSANDTYPETQTPFGSVCLGSDNPGDVCFNGTKQEDSDVNTAIASHLSGPPANTDPVMIGNDNYNGIGYVCLDSPCSQYGIYWVMRGSNGGGCAGGFIDTNVTPIGAPIPVTNAVCAYASDRDLYQTIYP